MEQKIRVKPNQSFLDVILQGCGTMEDGMQMAADNDIPISYMPPVDSELLISEAVAAKSDKVVLKYLQQHDIVIGTKGGTANFIITEDEDIILSEGGDILTEE